MRTAVAFGTGMVFALGLGLGGMTQPARIIGFLDVAGVWDPTLVFVLAGAVGSHMLAWLWIRRRRNPVFAYGFQIPRERLIDTRLVLGAVLFGVGWGIGGYCPGPAVTSVVSGQPVALAFVGAMLAGVALFDLTPLGSPRVRSPLPAEAGTAARPADEALSALTDA